MRSSHLLSGYQPTYRRLYASGELADRVRSGLDKLARCYLCPRNCGIDRSVNKHGQCLIGRDIKLGGYFPHFGEEACLRGHYGSGAIFFSACNLRCVFCHTDDISQQNQGTQVSAARLAEIMLDLQNRGCHNINLITPSHIVPQILEALLIAAEHGLCLPIVYNSSAYDSLESLVLLDGVIDIYLPDFKFWDDDLARQYLVVEDYPEVARHAIKEMARQVGNLILDEHGIAKRGVIVRHLIMPNYTDDSQQIMKFLALEVDKGTHVSIMDQYHPAAKVSSRQYSRINRHCNNAEYQKVTTVARNLKLHIVE